MHRRNNELILFVTIIVFFIFSIVIFHPALGQKTNISRAYSGNTSNVTRGDNIVPFSVLSNLSSTSPNPIRADCFAYGYVSDERPLGDLLIIKFKNDGSCNPTIELFTNLGRVLGIIPVNNSPIGSLGYDALIFIKYIETPSQKKSTFIS